MSFVRKCDNCDKELGRNKRSDAKYCDNKCKRTAQKRRIRHRQALEKATDRGDVLETVNASSRAGIKTALRTAGWDTELLAGQDRRRFLRCPFRLGDGPETPHLAHARHP